MLQSSNEWGKLKQVVVGSADFANWPSTDPVFAQESEKTTWKATPVPNGPVPQQLIDETNEDLEKLVDALKKENVNIVKIMTN